LQVLGTTEHSQINQCVRHSLHTIVPWLDAFKAPQQPLELIFPRTGPLDTHASSMDGFVEEPLASALGALAVAGILREVGDHAGIEPALARVWRVKAAIKVERGAAPVQADLCSDLLQGFQALR
jgi:hypothetical protein